MYIVALVVLNGWYSNAILNRAVVWF